MTDIFNLSGKTAIVTGSSSGLGVQFAHALARQGADVVVTARRKERLEQVEQELQEKYGVRSLAVECDVTQQDQVEAMVEQTITKLGRVDILVNNAGVGGIGAATEISLEEWQKVIAVNLTAVFLCSQAAGKKMIEQNYGKIINIASIFGKVGNLAFPVAAYHASKGGVVNLTRALAAEWAKHNITVNAIGPGFFESEMTESVESNEQANQFIKGGSPMHRWGKKGELDGAMIYLASDASSFTTGQTIYVDGGWTAV
ncbi:MAG: SDR family oxidoreductase [Candidatus Pacebacteria bacterium]|nr:SDR family oxidoreductase [Candidatus Paceibacterota bacterium]